MTHYHFKLFYDFHSLSPPLGYLHNKIEFFPPPLPICMLNTSIRILYMGTSYLQPFFLNHLLPIVKPFYYNGNKKIVSICRTKHLGNYD
jgi:hypothetical protein